ncbi:hypothetical protein DKT69_09025 [Micromonospora sicca]|uniref:Uncharacterized protein n=1 Tax=Micromonospora sicca TaxID=2202420 RepID=A0A317DN92_9ACTN|nr:hypothetical protein DKT69_09025 [Micromonospora sp. 4G51]
MVLFVAFAPPLWAATLHTLRRRTRLAVTALVLVVGLGGTAATPAEAFRPAAEPAQLAAFQVPRVPVAGPATADRPAGAAAEPVATPSGASTAERVTGTPSGHPAGVGPERPGGCSATLSPAAAAGPAVTDPGRDAVGRRGPPRD